MTFNQRLPQVLNIITTDTPIIITVAHRIMLDIWPFTLSFRILLSLAILIIAIRIAPMLMSQPLQVLLIIQYRLYQVQKLFLLFTQPLPGDQYAKDFESFKGTPYGQNSNYEADLTKIFESSKITRISGIWNKWMNSVVKRLTNPFWQWRSSRTLQRNLSCFVCGVL